MTDGVPKLRRYAELDGKTLLLCVGAMKCATSWIHGYLDHLPEVTVSPLKELHFFNPRFPANELGDTETMALRRLGLHLEQQGDVVANLLHRPGFQASVDRVQMIYDDNAYFGHFARIVSSDTRTFCDITPAYSVIGPAGFEYVRNFCASQDVAVKILFIMRDPIDRLWSQLRHLQQLNPTNDALTRWPEAIRSPRLCARADYRGTVSDLDATFPAGDILYSFYEDLFGERSLRRLSQFVDTAYRPVHDPEKSNETGVKVDLPDDARAAFAALLAKQYAFCRDRFGAAVPAEWAL